MTQLKELNCIKNELLNQGENLIKIGYTLEDTLILLRYLTQCLGYPDPLQEPEEDNIEP